MRRLCAILIMLLVSLPFLASAQSREGIGNARFFTNDFFGDGRDRWRSGSYTLSHIRGRSAYLGGTHDIGDILEFRYRGEVITPSAASGAQADRPYVGSQSLGLYTHFGRNTARYAFGMDLIAFGPQTGVSDFQENFHAQFDIPLPPYIDQQLENAFHVQGSAEVARQLQVSDAVAVRPFVSGQVGGENLVRLGADILIGPYGQDALLLRDESTGQLYTATSDYGIGSSLTLGADLSAVGDSIYLPENQGYSAAQTRGRVRAGVNLQVSSGSSIFYGATYLTPEFTGQTEGQLLGSVRLNFNF